jgi:hypothetical protein
MAADGSCRYNWLTQATVAAWQYAGGSYQLSVSATAVDSIEVSMSGVMTARTDALSANQLVRGGGKLMLRCGLPGPANK